MFFSKPLRSVLLGGCAVVGLALGAPAMAQTAHFDLPAQAAVKSIPLFAQQAGIQIIAPADQLAGITTRSLKGDLDRRQALQQLIKGTQLVIVSDDGSTVVLRVAEKKTAPASQTANAPVPAAPAGDEAATEVVVKGFKNSLMTAHQLKRKAVDTVDVIVAEDIAAFPDLNLAESLQRIPGITITRDSGEGRQIALRGLGADFTRTQLNGMEVLSNTASGMDNRGGVSRTRSFDYSLFASELFNRVTVEKSYAVDQDEGGIGGTVQLQTAKPFDYKGFKAVVSAKAQSNSNTDSTTPRLVGLVSNRWGNFGALLSVAYSENDSNEYGYRSFGWGQIHVNAANIGAGVDAATAARLQANDGTRLFAPQADTYSTWFDHRTRLGTTLSLQYQPSSTFKLGFDALYSRLENRRRNYALAVSGINSLTGNITGTQIVNSATVSGDTLIAASYSGVDLRSEYNVEKDKTNFSQIGLNGAWQATDKLSFTGIIGTSKSDYELPVFDKVFLESKTHTITVDDRPEMPTNTYGGASLTDPSQWQLMRLDTQENTIVTKYDNAKFDAKYVLNDISDLSAGIEYKKFDNSGHQYNNKVFRNVPANTVIPDTFKSVVPFKTLVPYIIGDVDQTYAYIGQIRDLTPAFIMAGTDYHVMETTHAAYLKYDLDTELGGYRVRGNAGLRYYETRLESAGTLNNGTTLAPVDVVHTYHGLLPAVNVAVDLTPNLVARLGANRDVSRPGLGDLAATGSITTAPFGGTLSVGNPDLKPFLADSVEGSLEYYQGKVGYASIGFFYKNMKQYITSSTIQEPYSATGYPTSFLLPGQDPTTTQYTVNTPINSPLGKISGVEVAYQRDFDFLPAPFNHLGFVGNATYADGTAQSLISGTPYELPLPNLSKYSVNGTLYYETDRWGVRVSDAYRDKYLIGNGTAGNVGGYIKATNNIDFAAHYNLGRSLKLVAEGLNLTNEHIIQYANGNGSDPTKRTEVNTSAGRTFTLGLTYEF
jgi:TonB-dependent receptor